MLLCLFCIRLRTWFVVTADVSFCGLLFQCWSIPFFIFIISFLIVYFSYLVYLIVYVQFLLLFKFCDLKEICNILEWKLGKKCSTYDILITLSKKKRNQKLPQAVVITIEC